MTFLLWHKLGIYQRDWRRKIGILRRHLHMVSDIFELTTKNQNLSFFKTVKFLCSQIDEKVPLQWTRKTLKKILLKSTKNMKLSGFSSNLRGLNYPSYQLFRPPFNGQYFLTLPWQKCQIILVKVVALEMLLQYQLSTILILIMFSCKRIEIFITKKVPKTAICQHSLADSEVQTSHAT